MQQLSSLVGCPPRHHRLAATATAHSAHPPRATRRRHSSVSTTTPSTAKPSSARALMTLRSRPSGPPRASPRTPSQRRGGNALHRRIRSQGINRSARRRRHSRTRFRCCDGRSPRRGTRCHARAAHRTAPSLWARDFRSPRAHAAHCGDRAPLGGRSAAKNQFASVVAGQGAFVSTQPHVGIAAHPRSDGDCIIAACTHRGGETHNQTSRTSAPHLTAALQQPLSHITRPHGNELHAAQLENECFANATSTHNLEQKDRGRSSELTVRAAQGLMRLWRKTTWGGACCRRLGLSADCFASGFRLVFHI